MLPPQPGSFTSQGHVDSLFTCVPPIILSLRETGAAGFGQLRSEGKEFGPLSYFSLVVVVVVVVVVVIDVVVVGQTKVATSASVIIVLIFLLSYQPHTRLFERGHLHTTLTPALKIVPSNMLDGPSSHL